MLAQFSLMPEQGTTHARGVDELFYFLCGLSGFFTLLIAALIIYFAVRYRRRDDDETPRPVHGGYGLEIFWTVVPTLVGLFIFVWGARVYFDFARPPDDALRVYVVGKQWMWKLQHPDGQREINELHVPAGVPVRLTMVSEDVIHSFFIPAFRVKQDVLPGRYSTLWFEATEPGRHRLFCAEYCGTEHSRMVGWVVVQEPAEHQRWLAEHAEGSPALEGRKLFQRLGCLTCHGRGGRNEAPLLEAIYDRPVRLQDGKEVPADDAYLRESILNPKAKVVAGYQPIMPTFAGQVSEEDILKLLAYIRSLGPGDTPRRVEETPPREDKGDKKQ